MSANTRVIGVASGKGGVGKTAIATNLAVALVMRGHKVMLFDADLGLANAQLAFGCVPEFDFSDVIDGTRSLSEIVITTPQGVRLIPGASGLQHMASLGSMEAAGIIRAFGSLEEECDYMIVDSAAGIADAVVAFMQAVQHRLIVVRDEPSSIADAYGMIKVLAAGERQDGLYLVPNMVASQAAGRELHRRLNDVCARFLGCGVGYLNSVVHDEHMIDAIRTRRSVLEHAPGGGAARDLRQLALAVDALEAAPGPSGGIQFFVERLARPQATT